MNSRPNSGAGILANTHDMDQEGLVAFTAMAEEAMKIERMVVQQKELTTKLHHQLQKLCNKEEKEKEKHCSLHKDVQSFAAKNKLLNENLQGKKDSRYMLEQMSADLERQLQLESNNIHNKTQNMAKTEHTYTEMIKQYESMYLSSKEAKEMKRMQNMKSDIISEITCIESSIKTLKEEYKQKMFSKEQDRNKLVLKTALLIGEHHKLQAELETNIAVLCNMKEQVSKEQEEIEMLQKEAPNNNAELEVTADKAVMNEATGNMIEKQKNVVKESKIMLNFATFTLPELQLPDLPMEQNDLMLQDSFDLTYSEFLHNINNVNERSEQIMEEEQHPEAPPMVDLPETVQMNVQEESTEASQPVNQEVEMAEVAANVPRTDPSNDEVVAQADVDHEEANETVMMERDDPQEAQDQEQMQERETESQVGSEESGAPGEPHYSSAMSQSSDGSSVDLLDDEKRRAYMMKLMAPPEFSVGCNEQMQNEGQPMSESSEYMNQFLMTANSGSIMFGGEQQPNSPVHGSNVLSTNPEASTNSSVPFMTMNSLFGESGGGQEQSTSAFNFGTFSFGASSNTGATNIFGSPSSPPAQNNPFASSPSTQQSSEAFNLNFDKTNTPSIFKLF